MKVAQIFESWQSQDRTGDLVVGRQRSYQLRQPCPPNKQIVCKKYCFRIDFAFQKAVIPFFRFQLNAVLYERNSLIEVIGWRKYIDSRVHRYWLSYRKDLDIFHRLKELWYFERWLYMAATVKCKKVFWVADCCRHYEGIYNIYSEYVSIKGGWKLGDR